ncbi:hypothetical protein EV697_10397 [Bisgaardia hudsonensis]|uniref:Uncharacterized protein n=1 Tax=Bisgaardia hudsonensis TaxID=109472 RepID=A0A4R2N0C0_9PAST|nr:hypothetical protein [Bisgaardia hudsonensis]QLB13389.1 hypothetical protein A6A11_07100 [Bisgaardia hudsonensis]TCP12793.1 hypothetical protein EV697_10397 [Bisgaardia hudsonensis]
MLRYYSILLGLHLFFGVDNNYLIIAMAVTGFILFNIEKIKIPLVRAIMMLTNYKIWKMHKYIESFVGVIFVIVLTLCLYYYLSNINKNKISYREINSFLFLFFPIINYFVVSISLDISKKILEQLNKSAFIVFSSLLVVMGYWGYYAITDDIVRILEFDYKNFDFLFLSSFSIYYILYLIIVKLSILFVILVSELILIAIFLKKFNKEITIKFFVISIFWLFWGGYSHPMLERMIEGQYTDIIIKNSIVEFSYKAPPKKCVKFFNETQKKSLSEEIKELLGKFENINDFYKNIPSQLEEFKRYKEFNNQLSSEINNILDSIISKIGKEMEESSTTIKNKEKKRVNILEQIKTFDGYRELGTILENLENIKKEIDSIKSNEKDKIKEILNNAYQDLKESEKTRIYFLSTNEISVARYNENKGYIFTIEKCDSNSEQ